MSLKKLKIGSTLLFCFGMLGLQAQQVITTSGGNASGSSGSVSFTLGQVIYTTSTGFDGSVIQGVQQPYEISVVTAADKTRDITLQMIVYPNPVTDFVILKIENYELHNLRYHLYDINARTLQEDKIVSNETNIMMSIYMPSVYFLRVTDNNNILKIFKIVKP